MVERNLNAMKLAGQSISAKLRDTARAQDMDPAFFFQKFAVERLLARLNESRHAGAYCIKGGTIMLVVNPDMPRATEDLDFTAFASFDKESLVAAFKEIAEVVPVEEDGMEFNLDEGRTARDGMYREEGVNPGFRLYLDVQMQTRSRPVVLRVKVDASYGEAINPGPVWAALSPTVKGWEPPRVPMYPLETILAEKLHAISKHGNANTRLRDFYDVVAITRRHTLPGDKVLSALKATFDVRVSPSIGAEVVGLSAAFAADHAEDWRKLMAKKTYKVKLAAFEEVVAEVARFARPVLAAASMTEPFAQDWTPGSGWTARSDEPAGPPF